MPLLEGLLQVTHNRLLGSRERGQSSWLHAFNWSLFHDPLLVWNPCEVYESTKATSRPQWRGQTPNQQQWLISSDGASARLQATDTVPPIVRHIWGLKPLVQSEGFHDPTPSYAMASFNQWAPG